MLKELKENITFLQGRNASLESGLSAIIMRFQETGNLTTQFLIYDLPEHIDQELEQINRQHPSLKESFKAGWREGKNALAALLPPSRN